VLGEWALLYFTLLSMVGVEEGREFRFCGDLYSQESTFPLVSYTMLFLAWSYIITARRYASAAYAVVVCPSVRLKN